jgi:outer membrane protein OmpA-like peptidoglycan-associated protein
VRTFIVFFDFDQSNLTAEAQQVVAEAVRTAMSSGMVRVVVTGHTDTVGSQATTRSVGTARNVGRNEMVRLGLQRNDIQTVGRSFTDPLVPTDRASASRRTAEPSSISAGRRPNA